jgi:hypothetical protein
MARRLLQGFVIPRALQNWLVNKQFRKPRGRGTGRGASPRGASGAGSGAFDSAFRSIADGDLVRFDPAWGEVRIESRAGPVGFTAGLIV